MTDGDLTARVEYLASITAYLHKRLFRLERRLLITGTLLTHADDVSPADSHHALAAKLEEVSREFCVKGKELDEEESACCFCVKLKELDEEENACCAHLPGSGD